MFTADRDRCWLAVGFPRIRGDVPNAHNLINNQLRFSPHTRGCSRMPKISATLLRVFPAYAGMFPHHHAYATPRPRFPRIRGDVPRFLIFSPASPQFSPHTRGCSNTLPQAKKLVKVFPAYAGMFLRELVAVLGPDGFPRIRGDVPPRRARARG